MTQQQQNNLPSEWRTVEIGEIAQIMGGGTPSTRDAGNFGGDVPWLTPKDLSGTHDRYMSRGARNLSEKGLKSSSAKLVPSGAVLLTTRAPVGYVAIAAGEVSTNQGFKSIVVKDDVCNEFIYYWLTANVDELQRHATGSTFTELAGRNLKQIRLTLPPLHEQRRIAEILGTLDDKIELNRRMNETLDEMARAIFKDWFVDFGPVRAKMEGRDPYLPDEMWKLFPDRLEDSKLGKIPEGWEVGRIDDIATVSSGKRPRDRTVVATSDSQVPLWGGNGPMGFVQDSLVDYPVVLTGRVGTLGSVFRIATPCWPSDNTLIFKAKEEYMLEYLFFQLARVDFSALNRGSTQPLVAQTDLKAQPICIPPNAGLKRFHRIADKLYERIDWHEKESGTLAAIRDTLLPKLISGEVRVGV